YSGCRAHSYGAYVVVLSPALVIDFVRTFHFFFFPCSAVDRDLHSFPTRRSSDLCLVGLDVGLWFRFWLVLARLLLARFVIAHHAPDVSLPPPLGEGSQWGLSLPSA